MAVVTEFAGEHAIDDRLARRNALVLAAAQALGTANNIVIAATASIVGATLAPNKWLITLPLSFQVLGLWQGTLPMGALARRYGRQAAFQAGALCGVLTGILCCLAVLNGSFVLFCVGTVFTGLYAAAHQTYRFAAADTASEAFRPRAISWVMAGGVGAAFLGPELVIVTKDLWPPYLFAASYIGQALLAIAAIGVLALVKTPRPVAQTRRGAGRPLRDILRQPRLIAAIGCGVASYSMMNLVMTAAPLAMVMCQHTTGDATLGIQWHVLGMFVPSFFTGALIARFGAERIVALGLGLLAASAAISIAGVSLAHFWIGLMMLGVGWNFGFIGATAMVTQCHRPEERATVQSLNDFCVFGSMAISSFASGTVLATEGWAALNVIVFPATLIAAALLAWHMLRVRPRTA
jgi:MFS family permease